MKNTCKKDCFCKMTEKEQGIYERGFEEGFAVAKRVYKVTHLHAINENGEPMKLKVR